MSRVKKRRRNKLIFFILEIVIFIVLLGALFIWHKAGQLGGLDKLNPENLGRSDELDEDLLEDYVSIAIFGLDNRTMGNLSSGNSDVIMVATIDNKNSQIKLTSVYRDTLLAQQKEEDGEYRYRKANAAFSEGGAQEAVRMLNKNMDLDITDYVTVDFKALVDAVDAVGGIEMEINDAEAGLINKYIDELQQWTGTSSSHLDGAGTYEMDGVQATAYCRIRKTALGDFGRAQRQRKVLAALFKKVKSSGLSTLNKVFDAVSDEIASTLSGTEIIGLGAKCITYDVGKTAGFPYDLYTHEYSGIGSVDVPCTLESNVKEFYSLIYNEDDYEPSSDVSQISQYIQSYTGTDETSAADYNIEDDGVSDAEDEDGEEDE